MYGEGVIFILLYSFCSLAAQVRMFGLDLRALLGKDGTELCLKGIEEVSKSTLVTLFPFFFKIVPKIAMLSMLIRGCVSHPSTDRVLAAKKCTKKVYQKVYQKRHTKVPVYTGPTTFYS